MNGPDDPRGGVPVSSAADISSAARFDRLGIATGDAVQTGMAVSYPKLAWVNAQAGGRFDKRSPAGIDCYAALHGSLEKCALLTKAFHTAMPVKKFPHFA